MACNVNVTDLNDFCDSFKDLSISLRESIRNIIKKEGYVKYRAKNKTIPQVGNFLSLLHEVDIIGETPEGEKVTSLFIKECVKLEKIVLANIFDLYCRELFIYNDFSKICIMLQDEANVPDEERYAFSKSYNSSNELIIMENLSKKGFKTYNKTQVVTLRFAELSIIQLAKFHAFSYVIKKKIPKYFDEKVTAMVNTYNLDSDWEGFIHNICDAAVQVLEGDAKAKITGYAPRMIQMYRKYIKDFVPSNGCLCHGDYKFLNIMVKEEEGEVVAVYPIDYQLICYGSPVNDLLLFIFSGTDREFRRKHLSYLKDLYFENFAKFLSYFDVDVNSAYSKQEFENDYEERLEMGLVFGLYLAPFHFAHIDEGFDVTKLSLSEFRITPDEIFADRVKGYVQDYIDLGYL